MPSFLRYILRTGAVQISGVKSPDSSPVLQYLGSEFVFFRRVVFSRQPCPQIKDFAHFPEFFLYYLTPLWLQVGFVVSVFSLWFVSQSKVRYARIYTMQFPPGF